MGYVSMMAVGVTFLLASPLRNGVSGFQVQHALTTNSDSYPQKRVTQLQVSQTVAGSEARASPGTKSGSSRAQKKQKFLMKRWKSQQADQKRKKALKERKESQSELISAIGVDLANLHKKANRSKAAPTIKRRSVGTSNRDGKKTLKPTTENNTKQSWQTLSPGSIVSGTVVKKLPYGALVKIPYDIPGGKVLLHESQMEKGANTKKLQIGQTIDNARIIALNREKGTCCISTKPVTAKRAPTMTKLQVGDQVQGKVVRLQPYGAFVDIGTKRNALLHVSRMSMYKVNNITDHVQIGQWVNVRILRMEKKEGNGNIAVSMLSPDNDAFVDRRDLQRQRMAVWDILVNAQNETQLAQAKKELLEIDRQIWDQFMNSEDRKPKSGEV